ncbi:MAG: SDR family NAD(P)-dependent oxidoreductase [Bacteroidota bacterium]
MPLSVVTGTTSGIGVELALALARRGYDLALVNRSAERTQPVVDQIKQAAPSATVTVYEADLTDQARIQAVAGEIRAAHPSVHALFNNAGVLLSETRRTADGREVHLAVNVLAPYLLTVLLRPALAAGAVEGGRAVVVTPSSSAVFKTDPFDPAALDTPEKQGLFGAYAQSKLAVASLAEALAPDYARDRIDLYAADPGGTRTSMTASDAAPFIIRLIQRFLPGPEKGAANLLIPLDAAYSGRSGLLISGGKVRALPNGGGTTENKAALLALCESLTGVSATDSSSSA